MRQRAEGRVSHTPGLILVLYCPSGAPISSPLHGACLWEEGRRPHAASPWEVVARPSWEEDKGQLLLEEPTP